MKLKLLFILSFLFFLKTNAQSYIFGKIISEENQELSEVNVINIRTDEQVFSNRDGHFMISGRTGDQLRFVRTGYDRLSEKVLAENVKSPMNITLKRVAKLIEEVEIRKGLTGDLKIDSKTLNPPKKVEKLKSDLALYISQKSDPRILAAKPGEFVQPVTRGTFSFGKIKDKWDDVDLMKHLISALGEPYFTDLKIDKSQIQHFIYYVLAGGFERNTILKYGYVSSEDLNRFQRAVFNKISSYKAPQTQK